MKRHPEIQNAVNESLSSVRFTDWDRERVLRAVRMPEEPVCKRPPRRRLFRADILLPAMSAVLVIVPIFLFALHARNMQITDITSYAGTNVCAQQEALPTDAPSAPPAALNTHAAIEAARACFEAECDTSVFAFDEYTVDVSAVQDETGHPAAFTVTMRSVYGNGCTFSVTVSADDNAVISHSAPRNATVPSSLDQSRSEIRAWYERYGARPFMWALDVQAEFSRRYDGFLHREPQETDVQPAAIMLAAQNELARKGGEEHTVYLSLLSERAFDDGAARYHAYCFAAGESPDDPETECTMMTFLASSGVLESTQTVPVSSL